MHRVVLVDAFCPRAYDDRSLSREPLGGTESAVVLLAEALAQDPRLDVGVAQHCRSGTRVSHNGVRYHGVTCWRDEAVNSRADSVIIINSPKLLGLWHRRARSAPRLFLWRHNYLGHHYKRLELTLRQCDALMVCVSRTHAQSSIDRMRHWHPKRQDKPVTWLPNPVRVYSQAHASVDANGLLFCSSPHKGLAQTLAIFAEVRHRLPAIRLTVCNPGYLADERVEQAGVHVLGALAKPELHHRMARALCVFYPQTRFAETFGLVAAEANALGTPILAPDWLGAVPEVVDGESQLLPDISPDLVSERLRRWQDGERPIVHADASFQPERIASRWSALMDV